MLPGRVLSSSGIVRPPAAGPTTILGLAIGLTGAALAVWCILTFVFVGKGTPAPFDPPRLLVIRGPYRYLRNPMYLGAGLVLGGAAIYYRSIALLGYAALFLIASHLFVVWYEEPTLTRLFGTEYQAYRHAVRRWLPRIQRGSG
ncbi:MAG TPA: isoprenylcysteine carboxylmethyltransferase family protein [Gemmatimonadales bacterium]|nr:isoprenylcysteine carboxylmethyltransferase family protein [Gemmatimonadales bacterium]